ncbi:SurA N-terminal domain-containing protein [Calidifontibacillus oryziterrae]|uniref:hypothetical protein n=1 Tax=Calidifontibacillus oryziterrae TaxID=1191699 RepID=UPI0002EAB53D|nr:hypothetical protein [Calidifontibacillus oryziterrae]
MKKIFLFILLMTFVAFTVACTANSKYNDADVVAVVKGKEITVKDIRSIYGVKDEEMKQFVKGYVQQELVIYEATEMGIVVDDADIESLIQLFSLESQPEENRKFFERQADYLDMTLEEYYDFFLKETSIKAEYMNQYIEKKFGTPSKENVEEFTKNLNDHMDSLLEKYNNDVKILVK